MHLRGKDIIAGSPVDHNINILREMATPKENTQLNLSERSISVKDDTEEYKTTKPITVDGIIVS